MLKYPCLILDHDDTVVQSEATINYPCFCRFLEIYRPGVFYSLEEYVSDCSKMNFVELCKVRFHLTDEEMHQEYLFWKQYMNEHIPEIYEGICELLHDYRQAGGIICVVSMSSEENIRRDYRIRLNMQPDHVFGCELPEHQRKPNTYAIEQIMAKYGFGPQQLLMIDDMKFAVQMARAAGCPIAFAGWGRKDFQNICQEMEQQCDYSFYSTEDLRKFLFN